MVFFTSSNPSHLVSLLGFWRQSFTTKQIIVLLRSSSSTRISHPDLDLNVEGSTQENKEAGLGGVFGGFIVGMLRQRAGGLLATWTTRATSTDSLLFSPREQKREKWSDLQFIWNNGLPILLKLRHIN